MKRLQEDQQLAEKDPEAWAHLQQTRAALMPYGWDKCALHFACHTVHSSVHVLNMNARDAIS